MQGLNARSRSDILIDGALDPRRKIIKGCFDIREQLAAKNETRGFSESHIDLTKNLYVRRKV